MSLYNKNAQLSILNVLYHELNPTNHETLQKITNLPSDILQANIMYLSDRQLIVTYETLETEVNGVTIDGSIDYRIHANGVKLFTEDVL